MLLFSLFCLQIEFVNIFPPAQHVDLYSVLPLSSLQPVTGQGVVEDLITACMKTLHDWLNMSAPTGTHFIQAVSMLDYTKSKNYFSIKKLKKGVIEKIAK